MSRGACSFPARVLITNWNRRCSHFRIDLCDCEMHLPQGEEVESKIKGFENRLSRDILFPRNVWLEVSRILYFLFIFFLRIALGVNLMKRNFLARFLVRCDVEKSDADQNF